MNVEEFTNDLIFINCMNNYEMESDGKCYCTRCAFNVSKELRDNIKKNGCMVFRSKQVQEKIKEKFDRGNYEHRKTD